MTSITSKTRNIAKPNVHSEKKTKNVILRRDTSVHLQQRSANSNNGSLRTADPTASCTLSSSLSVPTKTLHSACLSSHNRHNTRNASPFTRPSIQIKTPNTSPKRYPSQKKNTQLHKFALKQSSYFNHTHHTCLQNINRTLYSYMHATERNQSPRLVPEHRLLPHPTGTDKPAFQSEVGNSNQPEEWVRVNGRATCVHSRAQCGL